ncbi:MAG: DUF3098 domain-containing protein [Bacteroidales bacterium]
MEERNLAFGKTNYILIGVALLLIVMGFALMTGSGTTEQTGFNPDIFSKTRIEVAPFVAFVGFLLVIVGIIYKKKEN